MRKISLIVIHCSAVTPNQKSSAAQIDTWHRDRGWKFGIGYHYVIRRNGEIEPGRPEWMVGAHCVNHNSHSIGVCYEAASTSAVNPPTPALQSRRHPYAGYWKPSVSATPTP